MFVTFVSSDYVFWGLYQIIYIQLSFPFFCYRRYIAMMEMCQVAGNKDQLITLLLPLAENVLNILLIHLQDEYDFFFFSFYLHK